MNVSIIGGGISGLCAGIYAIKKGFNVTIYEKNKYIGGILNENMHDTYLIYDNPSFYQELGIGDLNLVSKPYLTSYKDLYIYQDLDITIESLKNKNINDIDSINKLKEDILKAYEYKFNYDDAFDLLSFTAKTKLFMFLNKNASLIKKYSKISVLDYFNKFQDEDIKSLFLNIIPFYFPVYLLFVYLALYFNNKLLILKDKKELINKLSNYFLSLGGIINTNSNVQKIILSRMSVDKIVINDKEIKTDIIIYTADPYYLFTELLSNKYNDRKFMLRYEDYKNYPLTSMISFKYNFKADKEIEEDFIIETDKFKIASSIINKLKIKRDNNQLMINIPINNDDYKYFKILANNKKIYEKEIKDINNIIEKIIISSIKKTYDINIKLNSIDIIDPLSIEDKYKRYDANISSFGIMKNGETFISDGTLASIKSLYIANGSLNCPSNILDIMINTKNVVRRIEKKL